MSPAVLVSTGFTTDGRPNFVTYKPQSYVSPVTPDVRTPVVHGPSKRQRQRSGPFRLTDVTVQGLTPSLTQIILYKLGNQNSLIPEGSQTLFPLYRSSPYERDVPSYTDTENK